MVWIAKFVPILKYAFNVLSEKNILTESVNTYVSRRKIIYQKQLVDNRQTKPPLFLFSFLKSLFDKNIFNTNNTITVKNKQEK